MKDNKGIKVGGGISGCNFPTKEDPEVVKMPIDLYAKLVLLCCVEKDEFAMVGNIKGGEISPSIEIPLQTRGPASVEVEKYEGSGNLYIHSHPFSTSSFHSGTDDKDTISRFLYSLVVSAREIGLYKKIYLPCGEYKVVKISILVVGEGLEEMREELRKKTLPRSIASPIASPNTGWKGWRERWADWKKTTTSEPFLQECCYCGLPISEKEKETILEMYDISKENVAYCLLCCLNYFEEDRREGMYGYDL